MSRLRALGRRVRGLLCGYRRRALRFRGVDLALRGIDLTLRGIDLFPGLLRFALRDGLVKFAGIYRLFSGFLRLSLCFRQCLGIGFGDLDRDG